MPKRSSKRQAQDLNELAASITEAATEEQRTEKNPAAVALGKLGGLKGGRARAESLSPRRRKSIAKKAAAARWKDHKKKATPEQAEPDPS